MNGQEMRARVMQQAQGAMSLGLAFIGVANGLFEALVTPASVAELAERTGLDAGYLRRWCEAAYAFEYLDRETERYVSTELGRAFSPTAPGTLFPMAVQSMLGSHMAERATGLMKTGERPGESVLGEWTSILPLFGPMLETSFGALFEREILPALPIFAEVDTRGGVVVDLGCGNGWYLRALAARYPGLRGIGLDGFEENIQQATERASAAGLSARLSFEKGDIYTHRVDEPVDVIVMNRALHHVWDQRGKVFTTLHDALRPGGVAILWEPSWPEDLAALREPRRRGMAFQNLSEHVQGNHFLRPAEIEAELRAVGMSAETKLFAEGTEAVVVGTRGA